MAYRRRYTPKRRYTPRRRYTRTKYGRRTPQYTTAGSALYLAKKCYSLLNVEKKVIESNLGLTSLTTTPTVIQLNEVKTSDAASPVEQYMSRDGRSIRMKRMDWESQIRLDAATTTPIHIEAFLVQGQDANLITYTDVFQSNGANQFRNLDMAPSFKVLKKWNWNLSPSGTEILSFNYHAPCSHKVIYEKSNDEGDSWSQGQLALLLVSSATGANTVYLSQFNYRARFIDN